MVAKKCVLTNVDSCQLELGYLANIIYYYNFSFDNRLMGIWDDKLYSCRRLAVDLTVHRLVIAMVQLEKWEIKEVRTDLRS